VGAQVSPLGSCVLVVSLRFGSLGFGGDVLEGVGFCVSVFLPQDLPPFETKRWVFLLFFASSCLFPPWTDSRYEFFPLVLSHPFECFSPVGRSAPVSKQCTRQLLSERIPFFSPFPSATFSTRSPSAPFLFQRDMVPHPQTRFS